MSEYTEVEQPFLQQLEAQGWRLEGNTFRREKKECLPLYEGKMIHSHPIEGSQ